MEIVRTCKYCNKFFEKIEGRIFSNHVRWCPENKTNGDKGSKALSKSAYKRNDLKYGKRDWYIKICKNCNNKYKVHCRESQLNNGKSVKQCCSSSCAHSFSGKLAYTGWNDENRKIASIHSKQLWLDPTYIKKICSFNKRFTSKGEVEIREYFKTTFPDDGWTFGGNLKFNNQRIVRDLYSKSLNVCIEYDGIWHFKNIHGQLKSKQAKDKALEDWCLTNDYRLIRIDEDKYNTNKKYYLNKIIAEAYNGKEQIIKIGDKY